MKKEKKTIKEEMEDKKKEEIRRWVLKTTFFGDPEEIVDWIYRHYPSDNYYQ